MTKIFEKDKQEIFLLREHGWTTERIAEEFGVVENTISKLCRDEGVKPDPNKSTTRDPRLYGMYKSKYKA